jgi:hypothetical protein
MGSVFVGMDLKTCGGVNVLLLVNVVLLGPSIEVACRASSVSVVFKTSEMANSLGGAVALMDRESKGPASEGVLSVKGTNGNGIENACEGLVRDDISLGKASGTGEDMVSKDNEMLKGGRFTTKLCQSSAAHVSL